MYLLPKTILPCEHLDTPDMRYLNTDHPPLHHPLSDIYDIEGYNIAWYDDKPPSRPPDFLHDSSIIVTSPQSARPLSDCYDINNDGLATPVIISDNTYSPSPALLDTTHSPDDSTKHDFLTRLQSSTDRLCFVQFTPACTSRPRWFLITVDHDDVANATNIPHSLYCSFYQRHPKDNGKSNNRARWWPEWREIEWNNDKTSFEYGQRIIKSPRYCGDQNRNAVWGTHINFHDNATLLHGPFDFLPRTDDRAGSCFIDDKHWMRLVDICRARNLNPPKLCPTDQMTIALASAYRQALSQNSIEPIHDQFSAT